MTVTPEQIEGASFSTVKRGGYRTEEVDRFLRTIADEFRAVTTRVRSAEGANEDLQAASAEMATIMRDVHAQLGEKRRLAEVELEALKQAAEREAAEIVSGAGDQAEQARSQADRVLSDAEHHAELLRSDGEQRVREHARETLRAARDELQELLRRKNEVLHAMTSVQTDLADIQGTLASTALSPDSLDDSIVNQTLVDLRQSEAPAEAAAVAQSGAGAPPAPAVAVEAPENAHPAATGTFFSPPDSDSLN